MVVKYVVFYSYQTQKDVVHRCILYCVYTYLLIYLYVSAEKLVNRDFLFEVIGYI